MKIFFLELNEINFDLVRGYLEKGISLPYFQKLINDRFLETSSEVQYEHLEPWIQWVSVHTGLSYSEHSIFRLGDMANSDEAQIFSKIEDRGYRVGVVSAMNARNDLRNPSFFIPDPWTQTLSDRAWYSRWIKDAIVQAVNDNAQDKVSILSMAKLGAAAIFLIPLRKLMVLFFKLPWALTRSWRKAIAFDLLLFEFCQALQKKKQPDFVTLFLNCGAHIQHHYMLSSKVVGDSTFANPDWYVSEGEDPLLEVLTCYDAILGRIVEDSEMRYVVATGLSQIPEKEPVFYYRLKDHSKFFKKFSLEFKEIIPRMTRDFLVRFDDNSARDEFAKNLKEFEIEDRKLFGMIDERDSELFVVMDFCEEITAETELSFHGEKIPRYKLLNDVAFVAIKNGRHDSRGFVAVDSRLPAPIAHEGSHVAFLHDYLFELFPQRSFPRPLSE